MVGDSVRQDVEGALRAGMRAVLLQRGGVPPARARQLDVPVIQSLRELAGLLDPGRYWGGGSSQRVKSALD